jgi:small subunit ribosomal protein S6
VQGVRDQIDAGAGTLKGDADWGVRKLAFEIGHRGEAQYHLFQLEAEPDLLGRLRHSLAIEDGVIRHRIMRLDKGAPDKVPRLAPPASRQPEPPAEEPPEKPEPAPEEPQAEMANSAPEEPQAETTDSAPEQPDEPQAGAAEDPEQAGST